MTDLDSLTTTTVDRLGTLAGWLVPRETAVLVVDMQEEFTHPESNVRRWIARQTGVDTDGLPPYDPAGPSAPGDPDQDEIPRLRALLDECRKLGVLIVWVPSRLTGETDSHWWKTVGLKNCYEDEWTEQISAGLEPHPDDPVVRKSRHSGFFRTELEDVLRAHGIRTVVVTGRATSGCVEATCRDAMARDLGVVLVEDCVGPPGPTHEADVRKIGLFFGLPASSQEVVELLGAGRPAAVPVV